MQRILFEGLYILYAAFSTNFKSYSSGSVTNTSFIWSNLALLSRHANKNILNTFCKIWSTQAMYHKKKELTFRNRFSQNHWIFSVFGLINILVGMLQMHLLCYRSRNTDFLFLLQVCEPAAFSKSLGDAESPVWPNLGEISPWSREHLSCVSVWPEGCQK